MAQQPSTLGIDIAKLVFHVLAWNDTLCCQVYSKGVVPG